MWRKVLIILGFTLIFGGLIYLGLRWREYIQVYGETVWQWAVADPSIVVGIFSILAILSGGLVGLLQLRSMGKTAHAELLLRLSELWDSDSIIESRRFIDRVVKEAKNEEQARQLLCEKIEESDKKATKNYFILIKVINLFETLAFLIEKKYLHLSEAREIFRQSLLYYNNLFSIHIKKIQGEKGKEESYKLLQAVVKKLT